MIIIPLLLLVTYNNVSAQTLESINLQKKLLGGSPQITIGQGPIDIQINEITNKIYVANGASDSVSVIDSNSGNMETIRVGMYPMSIAIDRFANKIYVANYASKSVSVIDGYNDTKIRDIPVGSGPNYVVVNDSPVDRLAQIYVANGPDNSVSIINASNYKTHTVPVGRFPVSIQPPVNPYSYLYVANGNDHTVSVIDGYTNTKIRDIPVGKRPCCIVVPLMSNPNRFYVINSLDNTVSVINNTHTEKVIPVGMFPTEMSIDRFEGKIYVANSISNSISVIDYKHGDTKIRDISLGPSNIQEVREQKLSIAPKDGDSFRYHNVYVSNVKNNSVFVINSLNYQTHNIPIGRDPLPIAFNGNTRLVYVANQESNTVSVINGFSGKVTSGVIFKVNPVNSGKIICNNEVYPTNVYLYIDAGTYCKAIANNGFLFNTWTESPLTNRNSSTPLDSSGNLTINRFDIFTINFKPAIPPEYSFLIITVVVSTVISWSVPRFASWVKSRIQLKNLEECINQIGKVDRNTIEDKIKGYYVKGKISEEHRQFLKDSISKHYEEKD